MILLCGIPGSGKTTIGRAVREKLPKSMQVETDSIRAMIASPDYSAAESRFVYATAMSVAEEALGQGYDVVLDATFPREEYRREALTRLERACEERLVVWVKCDPGVAYQRNSKRDQKVPVESFMRLWRSFETPQGALVVDSQANKPEEAAAKILVALTGESP